MLPSNISVLVFKLFTTFVPSQQVSSLFVAADQVELMQESRGSIFQNPRDSSS